MEAGTLIEFRLGGQRHLGVLDRPDGKKNWIVVDERGANRSLHPRDFTYVVAGQIYKPQELAAFRREVEALLDPDALAIAWEMLVDEGEEAELAILSDLLFSQADPAALYATFRLLDDDRTYFRQRRDRYEARSREQVAEQQRQLAIAAEKARLWQNFLDRCQQAQGGETVTWIDSDRPWLKALEQWALFSEDGNNTRAATEVLTALGRQASAQAAHDLLVALGYWQPHENLFLRRSQVPTTFPVAVMDVVQTCLDAPPVDRDRRQDLSHLKVYTIDDESTREIDDGLSCQRLSDGRLQLWVHVADPTRLIEPGDALDLEARRRSTTIYLPTGMVPMFPLELAAGPMSLVQGQACCALSFGICLDEQGAIASYEIVPSQIRPTYRLTYEDVDEMLDLGVTAEQELLDLWEMAQRRRRWRHQQGAIAINMPEAVIKVSEADDQISISVLEESAARALVAEMMILAGEVAGHYGATNGLPLPFRGQPQPELPSEEELLALPAGPVRSCAIRRCMPRSETSLNPQRHASLGLDRYSQVTSPIRRYTDLVTHFQIKAHLRGDQLPFSAEELETLLQSTLSLSYEAVLVERQTNRYWGLEYLRRQGDRIWSSLILRWLREHEQLALILIEDLGLELPIRLSQPVELGDRLALRVTHADPRQDRIQFEVVESLESVD
ncbi:ribonuclease R family protein [Synechococcus elongatus]|uniref:Exoribonuclease II n=2 Tax=Synechococcus elongatus TaxID=32046 RepID=Q31P65_SYNE7|nr:ribonuclease R family protein [Synechococcus elongatus]MBD2688666.1 RNB domain-containing ribonuclease [Synechococcus elongatus FACHB-1061]ABB57154.1 Exoribonuclease II [Synechococcus elongatus PCC 7942 = FACHB-805]AJD58331.1 ribonuclease [Synechococcus elongatus UTEX 2973]MBD2587555.1 RNB domain-containing ribonuclease [Synechococcus elongatus FACHB-242]MBD2707737.1 RNB domain-containing ribonuclease [Synechococcus elongatus PCC 7942 = FACHB-805]